MQRLIFHFIGMLYYWLIDKNKNNFWGEFRKDKSFEDDNKEYYAGLLISLIFMFFILFISFLIYGFPE